MQTLTEQKNGGSVALTVGDTFALQLSENPTTGYHWHITELDRAILNTTEEEFRPQNVNIPGAGGLRVWRFVAGAPGTCTLTAQYARSWAASTPMHTFTLTVTVA